LSGEVCRDGHCVAGIADDSDQAADGALDVTTDIAADVQQDETSSDTRVTDPGPTDTVHADKPSDEISTGDSGDARDSVSRDDADLADESEADANEMIADELGSEVDATDSDADTGTGCDYEWFTESVSLAITQTCLEGEGCEDGLLPPGCAANAWDAAIVEVPLINGINDHSIAHYLSFEADAGNQGAGAIEGLFGWVHYESPRTISSSWSPGEGYFGQARLYDGQVYDELSRYPLFKADSFTVAAWIHRCQTPGDELCGPDGQILMRARGIESVDVFRVRLTDTGLSLLTRNDEEVLAAEVSLDLFNGWFHFAFVQPTVGQPQLYIDGVPLTLEWESSDLVAASGFSGLAIGGSSVVEDANFSGLIDDLIAARRAFSSFEVKALVDTDAPFGSSLVPAARRDYGDVGATTGPNPIEQAADFELVGPRPTIVEPIDGMCLLDFDQQVSEDGGGVRDCNGFLTDWSTDSAGRFGSEGDTSISVRGDSIFPTGLVPGTALAESFSLSLWFRVADTSRSEPVLIRNGGLTWLEIEATQVSAPLLAPPLSGGIQGAREAWHHVALVHFVDTDQRFALFIDGIEVATCSEERRELRSGGTRRTT